jgi:hypothetical protein
VTGTVSDPTGAVIPDAEVTATDEDKAVSRTVSTDSAGKYLVSQLPPGTYRIEVKMTGFRTAIIEEVELLVGATTTVNVALEVGAICLRSISTLPDCSACNLA